MTTVDHSPNLLENLRLAVADIASYEPADILPDDLMMEDIGFDSIMMMDLLASLSRAFPELRQLDPLEPRWREDMKFRELERILCHELGVEPGGTEPQARGIETMKRVRDFTAYKPSRDLRAFYQPHQDTAGSSIVVDGHQLANFASYNYLGTNGHPRISQAVTEAVQTYGSSVSASRIINGEIPLHRELERELAEFLGCEDSVVQVGGHSTNVGVIGHVVGEGDLILHDALSHNSIIQGALMSGARRKPFKHNDPESLERELSRLRRRFDNVLVVCEGVYSMDGDIVALPEIVEIKERYEAFLMVDEAHSLGTIGEAGRGVTSHFGIDPSRIDILMGTLSKSLNSCGGYIAGNAEFIDYLRYNLPGLIFSVGMTPMNTAAALESLRLCRENPQWTAELRQVSAAFLKGVKITGVNTGMSADTPIVPAITASSEEAVRWSRELFELGINVSPITHPAVAEHEARLRFFLSRTHTADQLAITVAALESLARAGVRL